MPIDFSGAAGVGKVGVDVAAISLQQKSFGTLTSAFSMSTKKKRRRRKRRMKVKKKKKMKKGKK